MATGIDVGGIDVRRGSVTELDPKRTDYIQ